jgi:ABC-type dipeptide/oligopeptide/nickel transport system ATPase subunit
MPGNTHVINLQVEIEKTPRVVQVGGLFEVPIEEKLTKRWECFLPLDEQFWNIGLIVGSSGSGKSTLAKHVFGEKNFFRPSFSARSVIDDFSKELSIETICQAFASVGFNTVPSWLKPFAVLSTGEKFRVEIVRALLSDLPLIVVDEFTSVVDRQVAQVTSHSVQKFVRQENKKSD